MTRRSRRNLPLPDRSAGIAAQSHHRHSAATAAAEPPDEPLVLAINLADYAWERTPSSPSTSPGELVAVRFTNDDRAVRFEAFDRRCVVRRLIRREDLRPQSYARPVTITSFTATVTPARRPATLLRARSWRRCDPPGESAFRRKRDERLLFWFSATPKSSVRSG